MRWRLAVVGGDDVAMQDNGATALIVASAHGHVEVVGALLGSGAAVSQGRTVSMCGMTRVLQTTECVSGYFELSEGVGDVCAVVIAGWWR